jgi:hypothetical protein
MLNQNRPYVDLQRMLPTPLGMLVLAPGDSALFCLDTIVVFVVRQVIATRLLS